MQYEKDTNSEHSELFLQARAFLLSFEGVVETKKERITTYSKDKKGICHMRTMSYGIDFGFLKGGKMEDKYNLFTGNGKLMRILPQKAFDVEVAKYYVNQALEIIDQK